MTERRSRPDAPPEEEKTDRRGPQGSDRCRAWRSRQDQGRTIRNFEGTVEEVIEGRGLVKVMLIIFGRPDAGRPRVLAGQSASDRRRGNGAMAKVDDGEGQALQVPAGKQRRAPRSARPLGPHGVNTRSVRDAVQRADQGDERDDDPGRDHDLFGPHVRVHLQKPARRRAPEAGRRASPPARPFPTRPRSAPSPRIRSRKIAETKMADLNARDLEHACRVDAGTARSSEWKSVASQMRTPHRCQSPARTTGSSPRDRPLELDQ